MNYKSTLFSLLALLVIAMPSGANAAAPKKPKSPAASYYPPKPKDKWELGLHGGSAFIFSQYSDPRLRESFGVGIDVRKSLGYTFSLRGGYSFFRMRGTSSDPVAGGLRKYLTNAHELHIEGIVNLGNINFHRDHRIIGFYGLGGFSALFMQPRRDRDGDGKFETTLNGLSGNWQLNNNLINKAGNGGYYTTPSVFVGTGISVEPAKFMSISLEERVLFVASNLWAGSAKGGNFAIIPNTSLRLGFFLGGKGTVEPLYWLNPNNYAYKKLSELNADKIAADLKKDSDNDGVPDFLDQEPDTKEGYPVDAKGIALDSDKDGIVDGEDKEPFSPPGYPIDQYGVAQVPPPACCQNIKAAAPAPLPVIYFDADKYSLTPTASDQLDGVAAQLQANPDAKLVVTGYDASTKDRKYNEQLAYNRAIATVNYLVEKHGISRDRFIVKYVGEPKDPKASALDKRKSSRVELRYAAEGETGESNPPAPHPGLKAGSNK